MRDTFRAYRGNDNDIVAKLDVLLPRDIDVDALQDAVLKAIDLVEASLNYGHDADVPEPPIQQVPVPGSVPYRSSDKETTWNAQLLVNALTATDDGRRLLELPRQELQEAFQELKRLRSAQPVTHETKNVFFHMFSKLLPIEDFSNARLAGLVQTKDTKHPMGVALEPLVFHAKGKAFTVPIDGEDLTLKLVPSYDFELDALKRNVALMEASCTFATPYRTLTRRTTYKTRRGYVLGSHVEFPKDDGECYEVKLHLRIQDSAMEILKAVMMLFSRGKLVPHCVHLIVETTIVTKSDHRKVLWEDHSFMTKLVSFLRDYLFKVDVYLDKTTSRPQQYGSEMRACADSVYALVREVLKRRLVMGHSFKEEFGDVYSNRSERLLYLDITPQNLRQYGNIQNSKVLVVFAKTSQDVNSFVVQQNYHNYPTHNNLIIVAYQHASVSRQTAKKVNESYANLYMTPNTSCLIKLEREIFNNEILKDIVDHKHLINTVMHQTRGEDVQMQDRIGPLKKLGYTRKGGKWQAPSPL